MNSKNRDLNGLEIAVIGMSGRFPGAENVAQFWQNLVDGVESISFFTDSELEEAGIDTQTLENPNYVRARGALTDIEYFDAAFFGYTPHEAEILEPQMRVFHEVVWEALEDAGYSHTGFDGLIGLYAGASSSFQWEALSYLSGNDAQMGEFKTAELTDRDHLSTKISYKQDLRGPSIMIQTACSTSLVAVHMAAQAILNAECDIALAGGVTVSVPTKLGYTYEEGMIMSPDGHCQAFDRKAKGAMFGNGAGVVVLKRLEDAIDAGDYIYAIIKGSAVNNDGSLKVGFTAPAVRGQVEVIRMAYQMAEVEPESIGYIEAHGTGTILGDPIEIEALVKAFNTEKKALCAIGSVKTNIGHLDNAAGVAGLIKAILCLKHRCIPPSLHFESPNPSIDFENSPFYVIRQLSSWKNEHQPLRAGVSSFGIGGTNVHVVLEEAPPAQALPVNPRPYELILLSAKTEAALLKQQEQLTNFLRNLRNDFQLTDVAYTLQVGRTAFKHRAIAVCANPAEELRFHTFNFNEAGEEKKIVFVFPGLGGQYVNMGAGLYRHIPFFKEEVDNCFEILKSLLDFDLKAHWFPPLSPAEEYSQRVVTDFNLSQLLVFIMEYALARLLMRLGITPTAMVGYSLGEYTAACLSGVFSLEDALKIVVTRGKLITKVPGGVMLSVPLPAAEVVPLLKKTPALSIAIDNGSSCIVAGPVEAAHSFEKRLREKSLLSMQVQTSYALHTHMMIPILTEFEKVVREVTLNPPAIPYLSNVTGNWITVEQAVNPAYWSTHLSNTVRFADCLKQLTANTASLFIEIGPGRDLSNLIGQHIENRQETKEQATINLVRPLNQNMSDFYYLLNRLGRLWLYGVKINWENFYPGERRRRIPLPTYPFQRQYYWPRTNLRQLLDQTPSSLRKTIKKSSTLDWFYLPFWKQSRSPVVAEAETSNITNETCWLLFHDSTGFGDRLAAELGKKVKHLVSIKIGSDFSEIEPLSYSFQPHQQNHYHALMAKLQQQKLVPVKIIHLLSISGKEDMNISVEIVEKNQELGFYSLIYLASALVRHHFTNSLQILVFTDNMQNVMGNEALCPGKATIQGACNVIPQEYPGILCRIIDIPVPRTGNWYEPQEDALFHCLAAETLYNSRDRVTAYRGTRRWIEVFEPVPPGKVSPATQPLLKKKGVYIIIGGMGNLGLIFARFLAHQVSAKLVLTGRTPVTDLEKSSIEAIEQLKAAGSEVLPLSAEVSNARQMESVVAETEKKFGRINGVIHAAGVTSGDSYCPVEVASKERFSDQFNARVFGLLTLEKVLENREPDFAILISSLTSLLGGLGSTAYSAVNCFMNAFVQQHNRKGRGLWLSVDWDALQLGPTDGQPSTDTTDMTEEEGIEVFRHICDYWHATGNDRLLVSTGDLELRLMQWIYKETRDREEQIPAPEQPNVYDRPDLHTPYVAPRNKLEQALADIWQDFFGFQRIGIHDDFFELGGDSLKGMNLVNRYKKLLGEMVYIQVVFEAPTIARLSDFFRQHYSEDVAGLFGIEVPSKTPVVKKKLDARRVLQIRNIFPPFTPRDKETPGKNPPAVFILSPSRSGSTLLRVILAGHSRLFPPPELDLLTANTVNDVWESRQSSIRAIMQLNECSVEKAEAIFQQCEAEQMTGKAFYRKLQKWAGNRMLVDKSPVYTLYPEALLRAETDFKNPLYIHLLRHPYGMIRSKKEMKLDLVSDKLRDLGLTGSEIAELEWVISHQNILEFLENIPQNRQFRVRFEDLLKRTQQVSEDICSFLGLEFEPAMLDIYQDSKQRMTDGVHPQGMMMGDPRFHQHTSINPDVADKWRKHIREDFLGNITWELAESFGYQRLQIDQGPQPLEKKEFYPVASAQNRLFFLQHMDINNIVYNSPHIVEWGDKIDKQRLENTINDLIRRHEMFRTSFVTVNTELVQKINENIQLAVEHYELEAETGNIETICSNFIRPFHLDRAPLLRVALITLAETDHIIVFDKHHIIFDGSSNEILNQEFTALYDGKELYPLQLQYRDYSIWLNRQRESGHLKLQEAYWIKELSGDLPVLNLPFDYPRPPIQGFKGRAIDFLLERETIGPLKKIAREHELSLFMLLLAVFNVLMSKLSGDEDIIIGTPIAARRHTSLQNIIGLFVNTLPLRNFPAPGKSFEHFLNDLRTRTLEAFENQEYQFEDLIDRLSLQRDMSRNPVFDVMFNLLNLAGYNDSADVTQVKEHSSRKYENIHLTSKFDLNLTLEIQGDTCWFSLEYSTNLFKKETIERFILYFNRIITAIIANRDILISAISIITDEEREQILHTFNNTGTGSLEEQSVVSLHQLFTQQVENIPDRIALIGLECDESGGDEIQLAYRRLNERVNGLAGYLREKGVTAGIIAAIMVERSLEMMVGILAILKAGSAYLPLLPSHPEARNRHILSDSSASVLLVSGQSRVNHDILSIDLENEDSYRFAPGHLPRHAPHHSAAEPAYVIYTSGSTGIPKGGVVEHRSVVNLLSHLQKKYPLSSSDAYLLKTAYVFDVSVSELFGWFIDGGRLAILEKDGDKEPSRIMEEIARKKITHLNFVPSMFGAFVDILNNENICQLATLKYIFLAGEPLSGELIEQFRKFHLDTTLENLYGPTEATVYASGFSLVDWDGGSRMPIGKPLQNAKIYFLDKFQKQPGIGIYGELCISGLGVARGYLNNPDLTAEYFITNPLNTGETAFNTLYRTGDKGRWLPDGNIEFSGRIDYQVKIRGFRVELGEIENRLLGIPAIREAVVSEREDKNGQKYLCAYVVKNQTAGYDKIEPKEIKSLLEKHLPDYMIPSSIVELDAIPLNASGKIDRKNLPEPEIYQQDQYRPPTNEIEEKLTVIWSEILDIDKHAIGIDTNFFELGGNSLKIIKVNSRIITEFQLDINFTDFIRLGTIAEISSYIAAKKGKRDEAKYPSVIPDFENRYQPFPITDVQMAYLIGRSSQIEMGGISTHSYNEFQSQVDPQRLNNALNTVISRHSMLRTVIMENGWQKVMANPGPYEIVVEDLSELHPDAQTKRIERERERMSHYVFNPSQWPLFDIKCFKITHNSYCYCVGFDPLISDAFSIDIIYRELERLYLEPGAILPELGITFRDYMLAYKKLKESPIYEKDRNYWLDKLHDFPSAPEIPLECLPSEIEQPHFCRYNRTFSTQQWKKLKQQAEKYKVTPSALLLTAYAEVLAFWSNQPHLAVNLTVFNRFPFHEDVDKIVGDFTSLMLVEIDLYSGTDFWERVENTQNTMLEALEHRHFDGVEFIREIARIRGLHKKAVMPYVFTSVLFDDETGAPDVDTTGVQEEDSNAITQTSQAFIDNVVSQSGGQLTISWNYVRQLFDPSVIGTMFNQYVSLLERIADGKDKLPFRISKSDERLLEIYNNTHEEIPHLTLHGFFTNRAEATPHHIALESEDCFLTYSQLEVRSNRVANYLCHRGIGRNDGVVVLGTRDIETVINLMGIIKSNAFYVPVAPSYPEERKNYIIANSSGKLYIDNHLYAVKNLEAYPDHSVEIRHHPYDTAYAIYTSGSTGRPKGVLLNHRAAVNTLIDINQRFAVNENDRIIGVSSLCFDLSVYDVFGTLGGGARLTIVPTQKDVEVLIDTIDRKRITFWNSVPAIMDLVVDNLDREYKNHHLRNVLLSGDWIPLPLPEKINRHFLDAHVFSLGGATEGAIWSIYYPVKEVKKEWKSIPYGYPLKNQKFYVLNYEMELCPPGVPGELYIGGYGVAEGYLNNVKNTYYAFIEHPRLGRIYRTGDYGVFSKEGYIEFLGRKDKQVKIRGYRVELGEIESRLLEHEEIKNCMVLDVTDPAARKHLCAHVVTHTGKEPDYHELKKFLTLKLPDYMVPLYYFHLQEILLTANGKINRRLLPLPYFNISTSRKVIAPLSELERNLVEAVRDTLNLETISMEDNFLELGGDSLKAITLISKIHKRLKVKVPLAETYNQNTLRDLSRYIEQSSKDYFYAIQPAEEKEYYPLSSAQKRLYIAHSMQPESLGYNLPRGVEFSWELDKDRLEMAFEQLIQRHHILKTSFITLHDEPVQRVHHTVPFTIEHFKCPPHRTRKELERLFLDFVRPFNLAQAPLIRVALIKDEAENKYILLVDVHHIVNDVASNEILIDDFIKLYQGQPLSHLPLQYKCYSEWQNRQKNSAALETQISFWLQQYVNSIPSLDIPMDYERPEVQTFEADEVHITISGELHKAMEKLVISTQSSLYTLMLTAYYILLMKYTAKEDIIVGTLVAGRPHADLQNIVGFFVNILPLRNHPVKSKTFMQFFSEVKNYTIHAFENQDYPYEELVGQLNVKRDSANQPLLETILVMRIEASATGAIQDKDQLPTLKAVKYRVETTHFDLWLMIGDDLGIMDIIFNYSVELFKKSTIKKMADDYVEIIRQVIDNSRIKLSDIAISHHLVAASSDLIEKDDGDFIF